MSRHSIARLTSFYQNELGMPGRHAFNEARLKWGKMMMYLPLHWWIPFVRLLLVIALLVLPYRSLSAVRAAVPDPIHYYPFPFGHAQDLVVGPDGNLWITGSQLVTMASTGTILANYPVSAESITVGPDSALWFTTGTASIGRITPAGVVTTFPITLAPPPRLRRNTPRDITRGPDGNLWFTAGHQIGRLTPGGAFTAFDLPTLPYTEAYPMTAGPDGAVWFTEDAGIGRMRPDGSLAEFPLPAGFGPPVLLIAGPDGNLWLTTGNGVIARMTPSGVFTTVARIPPDLWLGDMTWGPDGNLWLTEWSTNRIGYLTPDGTLRDYPLPAYRSRPEQIITGPDGHLWFTDFFGFNIGQSAPTFPPLWAPQISMVWPQDGHGRAVPIDQAQAVNIALWSQTAVPCAAQPQPLPLLVAVNNEPATMVASSGNFHMHTAQGVTFPEISYDNIPVADPATNQYNFLTIWPTNLERWPTNIWVHAADARTRLAAPAVPTGISPTPPVDLDSRIQIVWPHDAHGQYAPVDQAHFINIGVDIFAHGTLRSVDPFDSLASPVLYVAIRNGPVQEVPGVALIKTTYTVNGRTYPRWVFNDVPVDPGQQYHFLVTVPREFGTVYPTIWTHATDARTFLPDPPMPPACR